MKLSNDSEKGLEKSMTHQKSKISERAQKSKAFPTFQKKVFVFIFILLILGSLGYYIDATITGYVINTEYSFKKGLKEVREIEKQFNFYQGYPEDIDDKWSMLGYLSNIRNYVDNLPKDEGINALHNYMWFRTKELESKIKFQLATKYYLRITEDGILICPKREWFDQRMKNFNESVELGNEAINYLNKLISYPEYFEMTEIERATPKLLEAQYYQIEEDKKKEEETIMGLCFR